MKILKKLKKPQGKIAVIIVILALFFVSNMDLGSQATFAECDIYNSGAIMITKESFNSCESRSGCYIQYNFDPSNILAQINNKLIWFDDLLGLNTQGATCINGVPNGKYVLAGSKFAAGNQCSSGYAEKVGEQFLWGDAAYKCSIAPQGLACSNDFIGQLGKFAQDAGLPIEDCQLAGMAAIGIAVLFLVIILSVI